MSYSVRLIAVNTAARQILKANEENPHVHRDPVDNTLAFSLHFSEEDPRVHPVDNTLAFSLHFSEKSPQFTLGEFNDILFTHGSQKTEQVHCVFVGNPYQTEVTLKDLSGKGKKNSPKITRITAGNNDTIVTIGTIYDFRFHWVDYLASDGLPRHNAARRYRRLSRGTKLGKGAYATVYKVEDRNGRVIAVKRFKKDLHSTDPSRFRKALLEIPNIANLDHPHILKMYDYHYDDQKRLEMFMPLATGSLADLLGSTALPDIEEHSMALSVMDQMLQALTYLEEKSVIHLDIKPENILYDPKKHGGYHFYLADFGLARSFADGFAFSARGPNRNSQTIFMSPEYCNMTNEATTAAADIWALFATVANIYHPEFRRENMKSKIFMDAYRQGLHWKLMRLNCTVLKSFKCMVEVDPSQRGTASWLLEEFRKVDLSRPEKHIVEICGDEDEGSESDEDSEPDTGQTADDKCYLYQYPDTAKSYSVQYSDTAKGYSVQYPDTAKGYSVQYPDTAKSDSVQYPNTAKGYSVQYPDTAKSDSVQYPDTAKGYSVQYSDTAESDSAQYSDAAENGSPQYRYAHNNTAGDSFFKRQDSHSHEAKAKPNFSRIRTRYTT